MWGVKGLAQGLNGEITMLILGFKLALLPSLAHGYSPVSRPVAWDPGLKEEMKHSTVLAVGRA